MSWDVQQGADQATVQLAGVALVVRLGPKAGDAAARVVGVEVQVQADGGLSMPQTKHMRELGCLSIIASPDYSCRPHYGTDGGFRQARVGQTWRVEEPLK